MDLEEKLDLIKRPPTEEIVVESELRELLETNSKPKHYIGFEISGLLHVGSLVQSGFKIRDFQKAGVQTTVFLADWHSVINNKLGGDWTAIKKAGEYYAKAFEFFCPGVKVIFGSDLYEKTLEYWANVVRFSKNVTLARDVRCLTIMGRSESDKLDLAQYFYPPMQATDIHALDVDIAHAGMDQRKVHMLAREVFPKLKWKPFVAVHHSLLPGLAEPEKTKNGEKKKSASEEKEKIAAMKMSKSKPWTAIFIHDSKKEIEEKLAKAYCPPRVVENNPVLEFARQLVFHEFKELRVERPSKFGGDVTYSSFTNLEKDFVEGKLHPTDLKKAVANALDEIIAPIRAHFEKPEFKKLLDVYGKVEVTR